MKVLDIISEAVPVGPEAKSAGGKFGSWLLRSSGQKELRNELVDKIATKIAGDWYTLFQNKQLLAKSKAEQTAAKQLVDVNKIIGTETGSLVPNASGKMVTPGSAEHTVEIIIPGRTIPGRRRIGGEREPDRYIQPETKVVQWNDPTIPPKQALDIQDQIKKAGTPDPKLEKDVLELANKKLDDLITNAKKNRGNLRLGYIGEAIDKLSSARKFAFGAVGAYALAQDITEPIEVYEKNVKAVYAIVSSNKPWPQGVDPAAFNNDPEEYFKWYVDQQTKIVGAKIATALTVGVVAARYIGLKPGNLFISLGKLFGKFGAIEASVTFGALSLAGVGIVANLWQRTDWSKTVAIWIAQEAGISTFVSAVGATAVATTDIGIWYDQKVKPLFIKAGIIDAKGKPVEPEKKTDTKADKTDTSTDASTEKKTDTTPTDDHWSNKYNNSTPAKPTPGATTNSDALGPQDRPPVQF